MKKNNVKKAILGLAAAVTVLGALAGCSKQEVKSSALETSKTNAASPEESKQAEGTAEPITIYAATGGSPKPFTFVDTDNQLTGHNIDLIKAVFDKLPQYKLEI